MTRGLGARGLAGPALALTDDEGGVVAFDQARLYPPGYVRDTAADEWWALACAEAHAGPRYVRIDADDNEALADEHSVSKLPSFMLYKNGELASTFQGRPDESKLLAWARSEAPPFSVRDL